MGDGDPAFKLKPLVTNMQTPSSFTQRSKRLKQTLLRNLIADTRRHKIDGEELQRTENWCGRQKNQDGRTLTNFKTKIGAENNRKICKNMRQQMDPLDQEQ